MKRIKLRYSKNTIQILIKHQINTIHINDDITYAWLDLDEFDQHWKNQNKVFIADALYIQWRHVHA